MDRFTLNNQLIDFYGKLLSTRQQEILNYYYYEDLSLSEIADNLNISRNAVFDALKKAEEKLNYYENELHLLADYNFRIEKYNQIKELKHDKVNEIIEELLNNEEGQWYEQSYGC